MLLRPTCTPDFVIETLAAPAGGAGTNGPGLARRLDGSIAGRPWIKE